MSGLPSQFNFYDAMIGTAPPIAIIAFVFPIANKAYGCGEKLNDLMKIYANTQTSAVWDVAIIFALLVLAYGIGQSFNAITEKTRHWFMSVSKSSQSLYDDVVATHYTSKKFHELLRLVLPDLAASDESVNKLWFAYAFVEHKCGAETADKFNALSIYCFTFAWAMLVSAAVCLAIAMQSSVYGLYFLIPAFCLLIALVMFYRARVFHRYWAEKVMSAYVSVAFSDGSER